MVRVEVPAGKSNSHAMVGALVVGSLGGVVRAVDTRPSGGPDTMVYRGHRDCYCLLVAVVVVVVLWSVHRMVREFVGSGALSPPILRRQVAVFFRPALNGSHGEHTGLDDIDHVAVFDMVESELMELEGIFGQVELPVRIYASQPLQTFNVLCGYVADLLEGDKTTHALMCSFKCVLLCIAEEGFSSLSYTDLLYDLFVYRNKGLKRLRTQVGEEVFHFLQYDLESTIRALGTSPRESQLRSSHGELTEGDDVDRKNCSLPRVSAAPVVRVKGRKFMAPRAFAVTHSRENRTGAVLYGPSPEQRERAHQFAANEQEVEEEEPEVPVIRVVIPPDMFDKIVVKYDASGLLVPFASRRHAYLTLVVRNGAEVWEDVSSGETYENVTRAGEYVEHYHNDCGVMVSRPKSAGATARFQFRLVSGCKDVGCGWVYIPAERMLREKFGAVKPTESVSRAYLSKLMQAYPLIPQTVLQYTADNHTRYLARVNRSLEELVITTGKTVPEELASVREVVNGMSEFIPLDVGLTVRPYVESPLRPPEDDDARRTSFEVLKIRGATLEHGALEYDTKESVVPRRYLVAAELAGDHKFERAAVSANNQAAALVRVFKPRGGSMQSDDVYTARQLQFMSDLCPLYPFVLEDARLKVSKEYFIFEAVCGTRNPDKMVPRCPLEYSPRTMRVARRVADLYTPQPSLFGLYLLWCRVRHGLTAMVRGCTFGVGLFWMVCVHAITFRYFYSDLPHAKRNLRKRLGMSLMDGTAYIHGNYVNEISAEVKDETLKLSKPPRLFFSLGVYAPLYGGHWLELAKSFMKGEREFMCDGFIAYVEFIPDNSPETIAGWFSKTYTRVHSAEKCVCIAICSDDMAVAANVHGEAYFEVDISMCDSSVGTGMFNYVGHQLLQLGVPEEKCEGFWGSASNRLGCATR